MGRFINADSQINNLILGVNLYSYCGHNPVNNIDENGKFGTWFAGLVIGATVGAISKVVSNVISGKKITNGLAGAIIGGAVAGAIIGATGSIAAGAFVESAINNTSSYLKAKKKNPVKTSIKVIVDTGLNGTTAFVGGKISGNLIKINSGWFKPQTPITSLTGNYAKKMWSQGAIEGGVNTSSNGFSDNISNNLTNHIEGTLNAIGDYMNSMKSDGEKQPFVNFNMC